MHITEPLPPLLPQTRAGIALLRLSPLPLCFEKWIMVSLPHPLWIHDCYLAETLQVGVVQFYYSHVHVRDLFIEDGIIVITTEETLELLAKEPGASHEPAISTAHLL